MTRLADGPTVTVHTTISAPPAVVWGLVSDINISARFQDEFLEAEWIDDQPGLGARFVGRNGIGDRRWETTSTIVGYEPNRLFRWVVNDVENPVATWTFTIEQVGDGCTLTYDRVIGPGPSGLSAVIEKYPDREEEFVARRDEQHRQAMQAVVDGVKGIAESEAG